LRNKRKYLFASKKSQIFQIEKCLTLDMIIGEQQRIGLILSKDIRHSKDSNE
jgi:hypothetical protein